jgi:uncharacterized protein (DUF1778 family)
MLRAEAELTGETLTGFVLSAAAERAETVLERAERVELSARAFRTSPAQSCPGKPGHVGVDARPHSA